VCERPDEDGDACGQCRACLLSAAGNHPDLQEIVPEEAGKPIRIDVIRQLTQRSTLTPEAGGYRVFVLNPADAMTQGAANALLKTLEEPVPGSLFVLVSARPERLPATVRSRCQALAVAAPERPVARDWLLSRGGEGEAAVALLGLAGGGPLRALALAADGDRERLGEAAEALARIATGSVDPLAVAAEWQAWEADAQLNYLSQWAIDLIRLKIDENPPMMFHTERDRVLRQLATDADLRGLFVLLDELALGRRLLGNNLNAQLLTEKLLGRCREIFSR
jgi:DNA polymerase-3 subunit delta'